MGWPDIKDPSLELANSLGFNPGAGIDNTQAFANLYDYWGSHKEEDTEPVYIKAGIYETDKFDIPGSYEQLNTYGVSSYSTRPQLICQNGVAIIKARPSAYKEFCTMGRGNITFLKFSNVWIEGIGASNPDQAGVVWRATYDTVWNSGGILSGAQLENFYIRYFDAEQRVIQGSCTALGPLVMQAIEESGSWCGTSRLAGNHKVAQMEIGQHGQRTHSGINGSGGYNRTNNAGPNIMVGGHPDFDVISPTGAATANIFTVDAYGKMYETAKQFRPLPLTGALPTGFSVGTTVYAVKTDSNKVGFASNSANALAGTLITTTGGTVGFGFVPIWAGSVSAANDTITFGNRLYATDGEAIRVVGTNLPAGLSTGTTYYLRPNTTRDYWTYKFYDSWANAIEGGATGLINITTTGTLTDFGFYMYGADGVNVISPIDTDLGYITGGAAESQLLVTNCTVTIKNPYLELLQNAFEVRKSATINSTGGNFAGVGDGSSGVRANGAVFRDSYGGRIIVEGRPIIVGTTNKLTEYVYGSIVFPDGIEAPSFDTTGNGVTNPHRALTASAQVFLAADLNVGYRKWVFVDGGATVIKNIRSKLNHGDILTIKCNSSTLDFDNTAGINLQGLSTYTLTSGQSAQFQLTEGYFNKFDLIS